MIDYKQSLFFLIVRRERSEKKTGCAKVGRAKAGGKACHQLSRGLFISLRSRRTIREKRDCSKSRVMERSSGFPGGL